LYTLYRMVMLPMTLGDPNHLKPPQFLHLRCLMLFVIADRKDYKFDVQVDGWMCKSLVCCAFVALAGTRWTQNTQAQLCIKVAIQTAYLID